MFSSSKNINDLFQESFIFNKPKAQVGGDFYWAYHHNNRFTLAVVDCSGHGVPGAFMSLIGYNMLENIVKKDPGLSPSDILTKLNHELLYHFNKGEEKELNHGMDISLYSINTDTNELRFAGAHHPLYIIRNKTLIQLDGTHKGIGTADKKNTSYIERCIQLQKGDMIYGFTDGYRDQKGGAKSKKFFSQPFKQLLTSISIQTTAQQAESLKHTLEKWMENKEEQIDDILIVGVKYT